MKIGRIIPLIVLCGILFFATISFSSLEFFLRAIPNDFSFKKYHLESSQDKIEILILGSSHTYVGLDPKLFSAPTYNLAYSSQTLDLDEKLFDQFKNQLPQLKTVIIPISYFSYVLCLEDGSSAHKIKNYNIYYSIYSHTLDWKNQTEIFHQPLSTSLYRLEKYIEDPTNEIKVDRNGFISKRYVKQDIDSIESAEHAVANHSKNLKDTLTQNRIASNLKALQSIITWCNANDVKVILLTSPVMRFYIDRLNKVQYNHMKQTTQQVVEQYPAVEWWNYMDSTRLFLPEDFQNADHLSQKGAQKWSKLINTKLTVEK